MTLKVRRESVCVETLEYRRLLALARHPATGLGPRRGRPSPHSRDWGVPAAGPGCRWHPNPGPSREPAEGAAWRSAHKKAGTHRSGSWSTCTARPPWRPPAPRRPGPPRGTPDRPHIPGPGAGSPRQPRSTRFWSGVCVCARRGRRGLGGAAGEARRGRRGPWSDGRGRLTAATEPTAPAPTRSRMLTAPRARSQFHAGVLTAAPWGSREG